jgi:putative N6-adenine-specific DNA methylase
LQAIDQDLKLKIYASDISPDAVELAMENAFNAGVDDCIKFSVSDFKNIRINDDYGVIICNPPYGARLGEQQEIALLNKEIGSVFSKFETWSKYIITSSEEFEKHYGKKTDKKRKLYNGNIKVDYYQYFGPKPV